MSSFEDQLFADLMREHGGELATTHRPAVARWGTGRRVLVAAGSVGLAGAVVLGANTIGAGSPAYAVTRGSDGTITVSLRDISGVKGANEQLRKLGVPAVAVPMSRDCDAQVVPDDRARGQGPVTASSGIGGSGSVNFDAGSIPAGDTMVLAAQASDQQVSLATTVVRGPAPACVPSLPAIGGNAQNGEAGTQTGTETGPGMTTGGSGPTVRVSPAR
jgi:hypothetical protein